MNGLVLSRLLSVLRPDVDRMTEEVSPNLDGEVKWDGKWPGGFQVL